MTDDNFNFPRTGICTEYSLAFLNGIIWGQPLFTQTPCLSEHVPNIMAVGISFNGVDPLMLIAYKAFSVSFHGGRRLHCSLPRGVFRGACFPHNEKRAPLKTPAWKASFTDARGKFMENGTSMGHSTYVLTIRLLDEHGHICQDWDLSRWKLRCFEFRIEGTLDQFKNVQTNPLIRLKFLNGFPQLARTSGRGTQRQFSENNCSEDDLRSRIFGTFVVKFLTCLPLLAGIFENLKNGIIAHF